jgi:hypothetical protein
MAAMTALRVPLTIALGVPAVCAGVLLSAAEVGSGYGASSPYLWFFGVLALGGAALLATLWRPLGQTAPLVVAVAAIGPIGAAAGLAVERTEVCCAFAYHQARGFPFVWLGRGFDSPDYLAAEQVATRMNGIAWRVQSGEHALANVIFWACVALIVAVAVRFSRAAWRAYASQRDPADAQPDAGPVDLRHVDA